MQNWHCGGHGGAAWFCAQFFQCFFPVQKCDPQLCVCQNAPVLLGEVGMAAATQVVK